MIIKARQYLMKQIRYYCLSLYQYIRKTSKTRQERILLYLVFVPVFILYFVTSFVYKNFLERLFLYTRNETKHIFETDFAVVAIAKNEGLYIKEWIEYYLLLGVTKFYIYDNGSTDNTKLILEPYIQSNKVIYHSFPGRAKQLDAYNHCILNYKKQCKFMAFIDLDEFLIPLNGTLLSNTVQFFSKYRNAGGLGVNWLVYGSAGHKERPVGTVLENYLYRAEESAEVNRCIKVICNPRRIQGFIDSPHNCDYKKGFFTFNDKGIKIKGPWNEYPNNSYDLFRINHYYCKSEEEGRIKFERGLATDEVDIKRKWSEYERFNRNEVFDDCLLNTGLMLKETIGE